jgi:hypothetical protein
VSSFANYRKSKGKEWKNKVSKSGDNKKKKIENVAIYVGLMEWCEKEQKLKGRRGKKIPIRVAINSTYTILRREAEHKWKNFHSDLYDDDQQYHLLYEDGQQAVFIPGSDKEPFTLSRYHEELGKDFKRITLFLCPNHDFLKAEGLLDNENVDDDCDIFSDPPVRTLSNASDDAQENDNPAKRPRHNSSISIDLTTAPTQDVKPDDSDKSDQIELDHHLANHLQDLYNNEQSAVPSDVTAKESSESPPSIVGIVKMLAEKVDSSDKQLFIVLRRNAQLNRVLSIWSREIKRKPASSRYVVRVKFSGEQGIDSGAMGKEFFTLTLSKIGSSMFPRGIPVDSTLHIQNGNFKACGEIIAASLAQGGPAPRCLDATVYDLLVNPSISLQELNCETNLTASDRILLDSILEDVMKNTNTIIDHGYTGIIDDSHIGEIRQSIVVSIVTKRLVYLNEFMHGLDSYGLRNILQTHPNVCKALFVQDDHDESAVDANYLFSIMNPEFSEAGTTRKEIEESMMDFLQDFLFGLEDKPCVSGYAQALATSDDSAGAESEQEQLLLSPDCTPAGIMGWLTGQKHKPLDEEPLTVTVRFNHDCAMHNPNHRICYPTVGACAKEISFPVTHMKTAEEFNEVFMVAISKGQTFEKA